MLSKVVMLAVVFVLIASPATYKLTSGLLGRWIASSAGCPSQNGVLLHAAVFVAVLFGLWAWRKACSARRMYSGYDDDMDTYDDDVEAYTAGSNWKGSRGHKLTAVGQYKRGKKGKTMQRFWDGTARRWVWINGGNKYIKRA
jgi:hypothetical protein